jgi:GNAT superfamily N-acetyltransferase
MSAATSTEVVRHDSPVLAARSASELSSPSNVLQSGLDVPFPCAALSDFAALGSAAEEMNASICDDVKEPNLSLLNTALSEYRVRLYRPEDYDRVRAIFEDGMGSYATNTRGVQYLSSRTRKRNPAAAPDDAHGQELLEFPPETEEQARTREGYLAKCLKAYGMYTAWSLGDRALTDIEGYWLPTARSAFLVCEHVATGAVAGTVALQPVAEAEGFYADVLSDHVAHLTAIADALDAGDDAAAVALQRPPAPDTPADAWNELKQARALAALRANARAVVAATEAAAAAAALETDGEEKLSAAVASVADAACTWPGRLPLPAGLVAHTAGLTAALSAAAAAARSPGAAAAAGAAAAGCAAPAQILCAYDEAEMRRVSVAREHRKKGVAQLLVYTALEAAKHVFGYHAVHLSTAETMPSAVLLYLRTGFQVVHSRLECGSSSMWPCIYFRWPLGEMGRQMGPLRDSPAASFYEA